MVLLTLQRQQEEPLTFFSRHRWALLLEPECWLEVGRRDMREEFYQASLTESLYEEIHI
jgi:hypothetical protein